MIISAIVFEFRTYREEYELRFKVTKRGKIKTVRRHLVERGIKYFRIIS